MKHLLRAWSWRLLKAGFGLCLVGAAALAVAVYAFPYPVALLDPDRSAPLRILDRQGTLLRAYPAPAGASPGRHAWVDLDRVAPAAVQTVLASEDRRFYSHKGVDPVGILRAMYYNVKEGRVAYGGSTITMQLVRMVHSPDRPRTLWNKAREAVLAMRLERVMGKREILEQYLNRCYYGNQAVGLEAAARTYFDKPAASLSVGEATLLAVIPRGPWLYDPLRRLSRTLQRRDHVLGLLVKQGHLTAAQTRRARAERVVPRRHRPPFRAPHFVRWAVSTLTPEARRRGGEVRTSLSLPLQQRLQRRLAEHVAGLKDRGLDQAGMVVLDTATGEVLAMVGSAGYDSPAGQINIATRRRHPGSALKPFVYALALEQGDSPASVAYDIHDVPSAYRRLTLGQKEHGPVRYREALAGSYNLAAVHVLERVGVEAMVSRLRRAGVGPLAGDPADYGLRLALGSAKVRLVDLAAAYGFLVRQGRVVPPRPVLASRSPAGVVTHVAPPAETSVFSARVSWMVMDMLADPEARRPMFGQELPLDLPFRVAAKTGTARGFADTVAVGVTSEYTVAAWAGNFDGRPTHGVMGMSGAAPLVRLGLLSAGGGRRLSLPRRPAGLTRRPVCALSGMPAGELCPRRKVDWFMADRAPGPGCQWHRHDGDRVVVQFPAEIESWAARQRHAGGRRL